MSSIGRLSLSSPSSPFFNEEKKGRFAGRDPPLFSVQRLRGAVEPVPLGGLGVMARSKRGGASRGATRKRQRERDRRPQHRRQSSSDELKQQRKKHRRTPPASWSLPGRRPSRASCWPLHSRREKEKGARSRERGEECPPKRWCDQAREISSSSSFLGSSCAFFLLPFSTHADPARDAREREEK